MNFLRDATPHEASLMTELRTRFRALAGMMAEEGADGGEIVTAMLQTAVELTAAVCDIIPTEEGQLT